VPINIFSGTLTILGWDPPQNILLVTIDRVNISDFLNCLVIKNTCYKVHIPGTRVRNPKFRNSSRKG